MARHEGLERRFRPSVAARRRKAERRSEYFCRIEFSAVAAVLCGLLFAFLAATSQPHNRGSIDPTKSQHFKRLPGALREDALRVIVMRDGRFYLGNQGVTPEQLPGRIWDGVGGGAEKKGLYLGGCPWQIRRCENGSGPNTLGGSGKRQLSYAGRATTVAWVGSSQSGHGRLPVIEGASPSAEPKIQLGFSPHPGCAINVRPKDS
jgi:hypothetical protein